MIARAKRAELAGPNVVDSSAWLEYFEGLPGVEYHRKPAAK